jgi:hypothetical protein
MIVGSHTKGKFWKKYKKHENIKGYPKWPTTQILSLEILGIKNDLALEKDHVDMLHENFTIFTRSGEKYLPTLCSVNIW